MKIKEEPTIKNKLYQQQPSLLQDKRNYEIPIKQETSKQILLDAGNWSPFSFELIPHIGIKGAAMMAFLLHQESFWADNNKLQPDGSFYVTQETTKQWLGIDVTAQLNILKRLEEIGLISTQIKGIPGSFKQAKYIKINKENLKSIF